MKTHSVSVGEKLHLSSNSSQAFANGQGKAPNTAFLTMMVRDSGSNDNEYSPGDRDPYTGQLLVDALEAAMYLAPAGSSTRNNLKRNLDHWYETVRKMDGTRDWWQSVLQTGGKPVGVGLTDLVINSTFACGKRIKGVTFSPKACSQLVNARGLIVGRESEA